MPPQVSTDSNCVVDAVDSVSVPSAPADTVATSCAVTAPSPSTSSVQAVSASQAALSSRQWALRGRRSTATDRRCSHVDASSDISALAQVQSAYYKRQLEIAELQHKMFEAQHRQTMATLDLQHQYYASKLRKITEA